MNNAASHLVPSPGLTANDVLAWDDGAAAPAAQHDTWLLSFVDILALLLTLFVLLLAYQKNDPVPVPSDSGPARVEFALSLLQPPRLGPSLWPEDIDTPGFAMPGEGLLPLPVEPVSVEPSAAEQSEAVPPVTAAAAPITASASTLVPETVPVSEPVSVPEPMPVQVSPAPLDGEGVVAVSDTPETRGDGGHLVGMARVAADAPPLSASVTSPPEALPAAPPVADELMALLRHSALGDDVEIATRPGAVSLEIRDSILFAPASAALSGEGLALLNQLAGVLRTLPYTLSVEGHSDNVPIFTRRYPSNWELSAARAASVTRALIEQGVRPARVRAIGYGDTRPRSDNLTAEGRAKNRRVTFLLQVE